MRGILPGSVRASWSPSYWYLVSLIYIAAFEQCVCVYSGLPDSTGTSRSSVCNSCPGGMVEKHDIHVMCMLQIFFKKRCMLEADAKDLCNRIVGKGDGVCHCCVRIARQLMTILPQRTIACIVHPHISNDVLRSPRSPSGQLHMQQWQRHCCNTAPCIRKRQCKHNEQRVAQQALVYPFGKAWAQLQSGPWPNIADWA